jgi:hypothetical protein
MQLKAVNSIEMNGRKRPVAVLDADHTLLCSKMADPEKQNIPNTEEGVGENIYNLDLLNALKTAGIRDIYLFTDMIFSEHSLRDRIKLIKFLESQGFTVHGCITPNDYFWDFDTGRLQEFQAALGKANVILNDFCQKNVDKLPGILGRFPDIAERVKSTHYPPISKAYDEVSRPTILERVDEMKKINLHSIACKNAIDSIAYLRGFASCKTIMFIQLLTHKPKFASSCYVFDDKKENLTAVDQCDHQGFPVHTVHGDFPNPKMLFSANFKFHPEELSVEARLSNVVLVAHEEIISLQGTKTLGSLFYRKEVSQASLLLKQIRACKDTIEDEWAVILIHLRKISSGFFGGYQLSAFDIKLLALIAADDMICKKIGPLRPARKEEDPQIFLESLLSTNKQRDIPREGHSLSSSLSSDFKLPSLRLSSNTRLTATKRPERIRSSDTKPGRPRSSSEAHVNMDIFRPPAKPKSSSEEAADKKNSADLVKSMTTTPESKEEDQIADPALLEFLKTQSENTSNASSDSEDGKANDNASFVKMN